MVEISLSRKGNLFSVSFDGHSGCSSRGNDPVCAAVSAIVFNFLVYMESRCSAEISSKKIDPGRAGCSAEFRILEKQDEFLVLFRYFVFSLNQIASRYPEFVSIDLTEDT